MSNTLNNSPFLYPSVTGVPGAGQSGAPDRLQRPKDGSATEFDRVFDRELDKTRSNTLSDGKDLNQVRSPLKFSAHASQRLRDRNISFNPETMAKINDAVDKAEAKGLDDTLVLTSDAALIVSARNRTVITAMDKSALVGNVFTNIDGAVIV